MPNIFLSASLKRETRGTNSTLRHLRGKKRDENNNTENFQPSSGAKSAVSPHPRVSTRTMLSDEVPCVSELWFSKPHSLRQLRRQETPKRPASVHSPRRNQRQETKDRNAPATAPVRLWHPPDAQRATEEGFLVPVRGRRRSRKRIHGRVTGQQPLASTRTGVLKD